MVKTEDWHKENFEEPIDVEPEEEPNEIGEPEEEPIEIEPEEEPIEIEPTEEEPIEMEPEEEPIEIEPTEEEPIEMEPEEEPVKEPEQEPGEEPTEIEPIEDEPTDEEPLEEESADEEPLEEEPTDEEPLEEEPTDEEPLEEESADEEPLEEEPADEEPLEEEPAVEEHLEEELSDEEPLEEEPADEEPLEEEPYKEPFEEEPFEETPDEKLLCGGKDSSKETRKRSFELLSKEVGNRPDYQRASKKRTTFENLNATKGSQLQDLGKTHGSQFSAPSDKNQGKFQYKQDRQNLSQNQGSNREIDMTNLYIYNIPQSLNTEDLKQLFSKFGLIARAHVPMDNDSGLNRGYGFLKFTNATHAATAIDQMNGYKLMGMSMRVNIKGLKSESGQGSLHHDHEVNSAKLFVQHLPSDVTRAGLIKMFQEFGTIASAYLVQGKHEIYGHVIFSEIASAARAMASMNGCKIQDKKLCVVMADTNRSPEFNDKNDHKNYGDEDEPRGYKKVYRKGC